MAGAERGRAGKLLGLQEATRGGFLKNTDSLSQSSAGWSSCRDIRKPWAAEESREEGARPSSVAPD